MINLIDHIKLPFRKDKELYSSLYRILGFYPHHIALYRQALAHSSSAIRSKNGKKINNERLEFLGDAIIEAVKWGSTSLCTRTGIQPATTVT